MDKIFYDFWYLKSEEVSLEGNETGRFAFELAIGVFADEELMRQLDDLRIAGLNKEELLEFSIEDSSVMFEKLIEEGLGSVAEDIKKVGYYFVKGEKKVL